MRSEGSTGAQRGPEPMSPVTYDQGRRPVLDILWDVALDGTRELTGVNLAGDPLTPNQARALRRSVLELAGKDELPHAAIDAWERRLWAEETTLAPTVRRRDTGTNQGEPC